MQADILRERIVQAGRDAVRHASQGQFEEAAALYRKIVAVAPHLHQIQNNLGHVLGMLGRLDDAVGCLRIAIGLRPDFAPAHYTLGNVLEKQGLLEAAISHYRSAIALQPNVPEAHNNLGYALGRLEHLEEAARCYRRAIELKPDYASAHNNLGYTLARLGWPADAAACYRQAIALDPSTAEPWNNLGNVLEELGQFDAAPDCYRSALGMQPDFAAAHFNLAMALLARGDFAQGWAEYEWRWATADGITDGRHFRQPLWRGEAASGRTLLIHAEQGFGDTLHFCRFAAQAAAAGLRVVMEVQPELLRVLRGLTGVDLFVARGQPLPAFDLHCPMLSLPLALGMTSPPPWTGPYLRADANEVSIWRARLAALDDSLPRVGLVWAGAARRAPALAAIDRRRSLALDRLAPLFALPGVHFISLQKNTAAAAPITGSAMTVPAMTDFMAEMEDFADTAALIANLDLVISVDTAVAHLAAALGKPVWLLNRFNPCWRWLRGRTDSPWYPSLRLYRQQHAGDWDAVVAKVARDLAAFASRAAGGISGPTTKPARAGTT